MARPASGAYTLGMRIPRGFGVVLAAVALAVPGLAGAAETPKVWTNEDLERLFGPSEASRPVTVDSEQAARDHAFVERFLDRHYRLLEAEKERDLRKEEVRATAEPEPEYTLGYAPWAGSWWWPPERPGRPGHRPRPEGNPPYRYARDVNPVGGGVSRSAAAVNPANRR